MKRRHARGYKEYAQQDGLPRHPAQESGDVYDGEEFCGLCTYPLAKPPKTAPLAQRTSDAGDREER